MLMVAPELKSRFARLQTRWRDPLLTTLTILRAILLFVLAPLYAVGTIKSEIFELALILVCTAALFVVSGNPADSCRSADRDRLLYCSRCRVALPALDARPLFLRNVLDDPGCIGRMGGRARGVRSRRGHLSSHHGRDFALSRYRRNVRRALHIRGAECPQCIFRRADG